MSRLVLGLIAATVVTAAFASVASAQENPVFKLGFKALADQISDVAGQPTEAEHYGPNGDSLQQTTKGLMAWRKADNWTAFTDGTTTWINGLHGVQSRPNDRRFPWEADAPQFAPASTARIATPPTTPASLAADKEAEQALLDLINQTRQQNGVAPLAMHEMLQEKVARPLAWDMWIRNFFDHHDPDGNWYLDRMRAAGLPVNWPHENIAMGWIGRDSGYRDPTTGQVVWRLGKTPTEMVQIFHDAMMAEVAPDDGHRRNILNPDMHNIGIAVYTGPDGRILEVCDFME